MTITLKGSRILLAIVWGIGFVIPVSILAVQTFLGTVYHGKESEAWNWFTPNVVPTIGLIIATFASPTGKSEKQAVSIPLFVITLALSVLYVIGLIAILALAPLANSPPLETYRRSSLFLAVVQGLVTGGLGWFFIKNTKSGTSNPQPRKKTKDKDVR
jgi:hypothetical protein